MSCEDLLKHYSCDFNFHGKVTLGNVCPVSCHTLQFKEEAGNCRIAKPQNKRWGIRYSAKSSGIHNGTIQRKCKRLSFTECKNRCIDDPNCHTFDIRYDATKNKDGS